MAVSAEDLAVLRSTQSLLRAIAWQTGHGYADEYFSPAGDLTLQMIARSMGGEIEVEELGPNTQELGVPGYFGPPLIIVNRLLPPMQRRLALRHGLAHLIAGELEAGQGNEVRFMSLITDYKTMEERRADLFALADLFPDREVEALIATSSQVRRVDASLRQEIRTFAPEWPRDRLADRVRLRLALYEDRRA